MELVSDGVLVDRGVKKPVYPAIFPMLESDFELWNPSSWTSGHPFDLYDRMRSTAPVMWSELRRGGSRYWSVSRYEDVKFVELEPGVFSSQRGGINLSIPTRNKWWPEVLIRSSLDNLINMDDPQHLELRMQQRQFFIPSYVEKLRERVNDKIDSLLDDMELQGPDVDFVKLFSNELPLFTLCEMLGVDESDRPRIVHWMHYLEMAGQFLINPLKTFLSEPRFPFRFKKVVDEMFAYGARIMADRRANPREDLLTLIAHSTLDGQTLPQEYLDGSWLLIIFAGNDTTRNSLSGTMQLMTEWPEQREMVLRDPGLIPRMTNEALRMVSPVKHMRRTAVEEIDIRGQRIAKDEKVVMWYGAANRDPDVFTNPHTFDMMRDNVTKHLAFGYGVHKCLGSRIALLQLQSAFTRLFERFPNIECTGDITYSPNALVHAISSLPVNLYGKGNTRPLSVQVKSL